MPRAVRIREALRPNRLMMISSASSESRMSDRAPLLSHSLTTTVFFAGAARFAAADRGISAAFACAVFLAAAFAAVFFGGAAALLADTFFVAVPVAAAAPRTSLFAAFFAPVFDADACLAAGVSFVALTAAASRPFADAEPFAVFAAFAGLVVTGTTAFGFIEVLKRLLYMLLLMIGLVTGALRSTRDQTLDDRPAPLLLYAVLVALAIFLVHNLVDFSLFETGPMFAFAMLAGAALGVRSGDTRASKRAVVAGALVVGALVAFTLIRPARPRTVEAEAVDSEAVALDEAA